jgi:lysophospholipase L1-like esterase
MSMRDSARFLKPPPLAPGAGRNVALTVGLPLWLGWCALRLSRAISRGRRLASAARAFEAEPAQFVSSVLVVGDSTGVGVGAGTPHETIAGLLAHHFPDARVVNRCRNGARVADTLSQIELSSPQPFDLVLVLAGGNDVLRLTSARTLSRNAHALLQALRARAREVVWLGCANIGHAPALFAPVSWWFERRTRKTVSVLANAAAAHGAVFIDFCRPRDCDPFLRDRELYFADDGLHPSSASYRHCFTELMHRVPLMQLLDKTSASR